MKSKHASCFLMQCTWVGFFAGLFAITPAQSATTPIVIKFSHVAAIGTPKSRAVERFKQLVEASTEGAVRVDVYPNSTLYKDK